LSDYDLVYFANEGDSELWVVRVEYQISRSDPYQDIQAGRDWLPNLLNYFVDNFSTQIQVNMPENITGDEAVDYLVNSLNQETVIRDLENALANWFSQRYDQLNLRQVTITIERIKISQYLNYTQSRR